MRKNDPISKLMIKEVVTLQVGQPVSDARKLLKEKGFHHLPILDGEKLVGVISNLDIVKLTFDAYDTDERTMDVVLDDLFTLDKVMASNLVTVSHKDTVRSAVNLLSDGAFHALPVVDENGSLKGIVTSTDLIQYLMNQY